MTVLSLTWESPYVERQSLYWNRAQFASIGLPYLSSNSNLPLKNFHKLSNHTNTGIDADESKGETSPGYFDSKLV